MASKWGLLLHIYQPPNQEAGVFELVCREGYSPLLSFLLETEAPITLNVTGTLTEQLVVHNQTILLEQLKQLYQKPNITFTSTAYTHALLPLWPDEIVTDQLVRNIAAQKANLNPTFNAQGVYLPECAYHPHLEPLLTKQKFRWTVIDESSLGDANYLPVVRRPNGQLKLLVRHRALSQALATSIEQFANLLEGLPTPAIVALDGEVFGHFDPRALDRLRTVIERYGDQLVALPQFAASRPIPLTITRPSTWETSPADRQLLLPFPLWNNRRNHIHRQMWDFYLAVWRRIEHSGGWREDEWVRRHFTNAISSCYFWWANPHRTAGPFKMKIWNPDMIVTGVTEAIKAARSDSRLTARSKWQLETKYADLLKAIWQQHWKLRS